MHRSIRSASPARGPISTAAALIAAGTTVAAVATVAATGSSSSTNLSDERAAYRIYIDADYSVSTAATAAIEAGLRSAIEVAGGTIAGNPVEIVPADHRGSTRRSKANLSRALADPQTLAVFTGLHSPPLLAHRDWINEQQLLVLDPWAAAAPITRPAEDSENWIFRLSVDDATAGAFLMQHTLDHYGDRAVLIAEETGWGENNVRTMSPVYAEATGRDLPAMRFPWNLGQAKASDLVARMIDEHAPDTVLFVGNTPEAVMIFSTIATLPEERRPRIVSHWGILGGDFTEQLGAKHLGALELEVLQTRWAFDLADSDSVSAMAWAAARDGILPPQVEDPDDLPATIGFVHAHDLATILIAAAEQCGDALEGTGALDRARIRTALEHLDTPIDGILRGYERPFTPWPDAERRGHDALGPDDYTVARIDSEGRLVMPAIESPSEPPADAVANVDTGSED